MTLVSSGLAPHEHGGVEHHHQDDREDRGRPAILALAAGGEPDRLQVQPLRQVLRTLAGSRPAPVQAQARRASSETASLHQAEVDHVADVLAEVGGVRALERVRGQLQIAVEPAREHRVLAARVSRSSSEPCPEGSTMKRWLSVRAGVCPAPASTGPASDARSVEHRDPEGLAGLPAPQGPGMTIRPPVSSGPRTVAMTKALVRTRSRYSRRTQRRQSRAHAASVLLALHALHEDVVEARLHDLEAAHPQARRRLRRMDCGSAPSAILIST